MLDARRWLVRLSVAAVVLGPRGAFGRNCTPATRQSTCFDADTLWIPASPSPFVGIPSTRTLDVHRFSLGFDVTYLSEPVVLSATSPDPAGRRLLVVDDVIDAALSGAFSPLEHLELTAVLPMSLYRTGTGTTGITSQSGSDIPVAALRDVRLGAAHDLLLGHPGAQDYDVSAVSRLELSLPTGGASSFAGTGTVVVAPSFALGVRAGSFFASTEQGLRLFRGTSFGGARLGATYISSLGAGVDVLPAHALSIAVEAWVRPELFSQTRTLFDGTVVTSDAEVPAEWMASLRTESGPLRVSLGGGTEIPLSSRTERATDGSESSHDFAAITTPRFRFALVLRYAP